MSADREWRTVLFADLVGSTAAYEKLGNAEAKKAVGQHLHTLTRITHKEGGELVKTLGDAVLTCFRSPDAAARTALQMQHELRVNQPSDRNFSVRVGFHFGEVIYEGSDIFGDAVNTAARLTEAARAGQILTSADTVSHLSPPLSANARAFDVFKFKGKADPMRVSELVWEAENEITQMAGRELDSADFRSGGRQQQLKLSLGQQSWTIAPERTPVTIGRDAACSIPVKANLASRLHAKFEYLRGRYVLADHSTNGTYVVAEGGREVFLRRETLPLTGRGVISLGCPLLEQTGETLRYSCE